MKKALVSMVLFAVGCGGPTFEGSGPDDLVVADAGQEASEVDTGTGADMQAKGDAPATTEASVDAGGADGAGDTGGDVRSDSDDSSDTVPSCGDDEVYPQPSPTCAKWLATTPWPLQKACCRRETHTCGIQVTFSPFCVEAH